MAEPLYQLTRKTTRGFQWTSKCQQAFEDLTLKLVSPPILAYPQFHTPFKLQMDASDSAIGAVLSQEQGGSERVIAYWSRQLQKSERNYSVIEREALAAVSAIREFYPYLYGFHFKLITDHNPLVSLKQLKDFGGRLTRWAMFLQQFDFEVQYRPGQEHANADVLSRRPAHMDSFIATIWEVGTFSDWSEIKEAQAADIKISNTIKVIKQNEPVNGRDCLRGKFFIQDGVLCRKFREFRGAQATTLIVLPRSLTNQVLAHAHSGHLGVNRTLEKVRERFYWPNYEADVQRWVRECEQCQRRNPPNPLPKAPLETIRATHPFQKVTWDVMGPLPASDTGFKYILVITDVFTKWVEAFPLQKTDAEALATTLVNEVISRFGVPSQLHSDQGANFCGEVISAMCKQLGIERSRTTAYHPQGNGQVERFNRTLESMLSKMVSANQRDWDKYLPQVLFAYRTSLHETTRFTPFFLNFGRSPNLPVDAMLGRASLEEQTDTLPQYVQHLQRSLREAYTRVRNHLDLAHKRQKSHCHQGKFATEELRVGDRVWLFVPAVKAGRTKKLASLWRGPYTVIDKTSPVNYRIQLIGTTQTLVVHRNRIKLCYGEPHLAQNRNRRCHQPLSPQPSHSILTQPSKWSYADVTAGQKTEGASSVAGGYTDTSDIGTSSDSQPIRTPYAANRPQRNRRPPERYGTLVSH